MTDKTARFKSFSFMNERYEKIEAIRLKWVAKNKADVSMSQFLEIAALHLDEDL